MKNWGLRCGQMLAERADIRKMNIIERTALWYRLERIGKEEDSETPEVKTPEPEWTKSQWDVLQQLKAEVVGWREKHSEILLELGTLKKKSSVKGKSKYD